MILAKKPTIAVFRALQLGDMLVAIPAFRSLRATFPYSEVTLIGLPWAQEFSARFSSYIDRFIPFPGCKGLPEQEPNQKNFEEFLKKIRRVNFDLAIQLHGNGSISNNLVSSFNAKSMAGSYVKNSPCPNRLTFEEYQNNISEIQRCLNVIKKIGCLDQGEFLEFPIFPKEESQLNKITEFSLRTPFVCIHPGARDPKRRWPPEYFAAVADYLSTLNLRIVITGTREEAYLAKKIKSIMKSPVLDLTGKLSLGTLGALLKKAVLLISNCTAVSHIADALQTPSVIIYTTSDVKRWAPSDITLHRRITKKNSHNPKMVALEALDLLADNFTSQFLDL